MCVLCCVGKWGVETAAVKRKEGEVDTEFQKEKTAQAKFCEQKHEWGFRKSKNSL